MFRNLPETLLASPARLAVLRVLLHAPDHERTGRAIARAAGLSATWASETLGDLEGLGLVRRRTVPPADLWRLNREHALVAEVQHVLDMDRRAWAQMRNTLQPLLRRPGVDTAVLYGSTARREERPDSDVDLFIVVQDEEAKAAVRKAAPSLSLKFARRFGNPLQVIVYTKRELRRKRGLPLVESIRRDGIVLKGVAI